MSTRSIASMSLALLLLAVVACGDEDPVAPGDSAFQTVVTLRGDDFSYQSYYDPELIYTSHVLEWAVDGAMVKDYAPGRQVKITCRFDPPIVARRGGISASVALETDPRGFCSTDHTDAEGDFGVTGDWPLSDSQVRVMRECAESLPIAATRWLFAPVSEGSELSLVTVTFVVPATYVSGQPIAADDLPVVSVRISSTDDGVNTRDDPPVWPAGTALPQPTTR